MSEELKKKAKDSKAAADEVKPAADDVKSAEASEPSTEASTAKPEASAEPEAAKPEVKQPPEVDWKDQYARLLADFDNYKKRAARDREDTYRFAESDILRDILPTCDNLSLALVNAKDKDDDFVKGVQLVFDTLVKALKDHGAEPFDSVGQPLDTEKMEAIATLPSAEVEEGKVSNEVKRGWMLKGKVLRAAQVVVSSGAPAA